MRKAYTLITGASSGMGALCAKQFSLNRCLILAGRNLEKLTAVKSECNNHNNIILWQSDFAIERNVISQQLTALLKENNAEINTYLHFAGINKLSPIKTTSIDLIDITFNVNLFSIFEIMKVLTKKVNNNSLKNVVLTSALFSERGNVGNAVYAASKGAINSLVYTMARELAPIRINALLPGAVETPMSANLNEAYIKELENDTPLGFGTPQDVVDYAEFLISEKARWITGQCIFIDGGRSTK